MFFSLKVVSKGTINSTNRPIQFYCLCQPQLQRGTTPIATLSCNLWLLACQHCGCMPLLDVCVLQRGLTAIYQQPQRSILCEYTKLPACTLITLASTLPVTSVGPSSHPVAPIFMSSKCPRALQMVSHGGELAKGALELLMRILHNILADPHANKYRCVSVKSGLAAVP